MVAVPSVNPDGDAGGTIPGEARLGAWMADHLRGLGAAVEIRPLAKGRPNGDERVRAHVEELIAVDGTLLPALPRMAWASWQDAQHRAGKLHLAFAVWRNVPVEFTVTAGNASERAAWKEKLRADVCYVNDRHYSHDYKLMKDVQQARASHVLRLYNNAVFERLGPARALSEADRAADTGSRSRKRE